MKKELLFYSALLAALTGCGERAENFDRATLDKMLSKLERKYEKLDSGSYGVAMCYVMVFRSERTEYICSDCGERTIYLSPDELKSLQYAKDGAKQLRELGLNIEVNEQAFCHKCTPDKTVFINEKFPISGIIVEDIKQSEKFTDFPEVFQILKGTKVLIEHSDEDTFMVKAETLFIHRDAFDKDLEQEEDLPEWVRTDNSKMSCYVPQESVTDIVYEEILLSQVTPSPVWTITISYCARSGLGRI